MSYNLPTGLSRSDKIHMGLEEPIFGEDYMAIYCKICGEPILHNEEEFMNCHAECLKEEEE